MLHAERQFGHAFYGQNDQVVKAMDGKSIGLCTRAVSYTHLRAHETPEHLVCRLLLEKKK